MSTDKPATLHWVACCRVLHIPPSINRFTRLYRLVHNYLPLAMEISKADETNHEHIAKKPRLGDNASAAAAQADSHERGGPSIKSLLQIPAGMPKDPSPGAMHGCRIATWHWPGDEPAYVSAVASGASVYWSQVRLQQPVTPEQGKEGILLPVRLQAPSIVHLSDIQHAGEVQALALAAVPQQQEQQQLLLATVDAFGSAVLSKVQVSATRSFATIGSDADDAESAAAAAAGAPKVLNQIKLRPQDGCREAGWTGICFSSSSSSSTSAGLKLATARGFAKDVNLYDAETGSVIRTNYTSLNPYALRFLPAGVGGDGSSLLAVAENHMVSLWDARASGSAGGCVQRIAVAAVGNPLYTLDWCTAQGGLLGSAGSERSVFLTEPRKWRTVTKWGGATRLAIHSLSFLERDPQYAVLAGLDMEVLCGRWDKPGSNTRVFQSMVPGEDEQPAAAAAAAAAPGAPGSGDRTRGNAAADAAVAAAGGGGGFSFRGDARWLGVSKAVGSDVLAGFAASGNLVYASLC